jgi:hypothetical protein
MLNKLCKNREKRISDWSFGVKLATNKNCKNERKASLEIVNNT